MKEAIVNADNIVLNSDYEIVGTSFLGAAASWGKLLGEGFSAFVDIGFEKNEDTGKYERKLNSVFTILKVAKKQFET